MVKVFCFGFFDRENGQNFDFWFDYLTWGYEFAWGYGRYMVLSCMKVSGMYGL